MRITIILLLILLVVPVWATADDTPFKVCLLAHHTFAIGDYWTTFAASRSMGFIERNPVTRLYWRSPPAFCVLKAAEVVLFDTVFKWVYKKNKLLGYVTVAVFTIVRYVAIKDNLEVMIR